MNNFGQILYVDGSIIFSAQGSNRVYVICLANDIIEQCEIKEIIDGIYSLENVDGEIWLTSKKNEIYSWDRLKNSITKKVTLPKKFGKYKVGVNNKLYIDTQYDVDGIFFYIKCMGQHVWFIPRKHNMIFRVHKKSLKVEEICIPYEEEDSNTWKKRKIEAKYCLEYVRENRYLGIYSYKNNYIIEIDTKLLEIEIKDFFISKADKDLLLLHLYKKRGILIETENSGLVDYIENLEMYKTKFNESKENGINIYRFVR